MAYAAVLSLVRILEEIKDPVRGVRHDKQQIESLQEKVSFLLDFLEKYSACTDKLAKELEIKIRDAAYEAEDIIESYVSTSVLSELDGGNSTLEGFQTFYQDLDRVIEETHSIEREAMKVKHILDREYAQQGNHSPVDRSRLTFSDKASPLVGLVEDTVKIKEWLTSSSSNREVISIVGMGGIGKTTLARNLFDDSLIVYHFHVRAWVTVSQEYQMREILARLLDSTGCKPGPEMREASSEDQLAELLYKSLKGKTYLIVMDDVWDTKVWDEINRLFPDDNNGSRVVLTTRLNNVRDHAASTGCLHDMSFLSPSESWNLFQVKTFGGECCPPHLEGIGQEIVKNCRGLPLSIVVIGGLLSMDKTVGYWETIATALKSILTTDGGQCSTIFSLSYNHLPAHLKPCFLYFAIFPEDYIIRRSVVIKLWIAEGFIKPNESKSLEDIAEECLEDLLNRSLIMALELGHRGKVKSYRIHDLLRDFCITEAQKENFLHVTSKYNIQSEGIRSERRVSIHPQSHMESIKYAFNSNGPPSPARSLLLYEQNADIMVSEPNFGLLRVYIGNWSPEFPTKVVRLVNLRYLSLRCWRVRVPASISSLWGLQTLVIGNMGDLLIQNRVDDFIHLPIEIWTMLHLRHVEIRNRFCILPDPPNSNLVILANLQTLWGIGRMRFTDEIIKRIPKLKKLKVYYVSKKWSHCHISNIGCLKELKSLTLASYQKIPPNLNFPAALKKLKLSHCGLGWKYLTMVGLLPNLEVLKLFWGACKGKVWETNEGEFRQLKSLQLHSLDLEEWRADESHFPVLECLEISGCENLKEIPTEIGNIPTLEKIELEDGIPSAVASARQILDQQRSFGNDVLQLRIK